MSKLVTRDMGFVCPMNERKLAPTEQLSSISMAMAISRLSRKLSIPFPRETINGLSSMSEKEFIEKKFMYRKTDRISS